MFNIIKIENNRNNKNKTRNRKGYIKVHNFNEYKSVKF